MSERPVSVRCDDCGKWIVVRTDGTGILHARHDCDESMTPNARAAMDFNAAGFAARIEA